MFKSEDTQTHLMSLVTLKKQFVSIWQDKVRHITSICYYSICKNIILCIFVYTAQKSWQARVMVRAVPLNDDSMDHWTDYGSNQNVFL